MSSVENKEKILSFFKNKKVLVTGNTGFKGSWLTYILLKAGADVTGYALVPPTEPSLYKIIKLKENENLTQYYEDIRDIDTLKKVFFESKPEIVFHLAAQPIVRDSFRDPVGTYSTNVMGTVNTCECVRLSHISSEDGGLCNGDWQGVRSFLNITTDKVYRNNEWPWGYREDDFLDGLDPYSNSKSCSELVTHSYKESFFRDLKVAVSTARAGNVIGGGDFSDDRIIPDCVRSLMIAKEQGTDKGIISVRNPDSTRPYEHVLEPLFAYLMIASKQYSEISYSGYYNVGPDDADCLKTGVLVSQFCKSWNNSGDIQRACSDNLKISWSKISEKNAPYEANYLKLDCSKLKSIFGWSPTWHISDAIEQTVKWTKVWLGTGDYNDIRIEMDREIECFINGR